MTVLQSPSRVRLEIIEVPHPCPADWSAMGKVDGDRVRHCKHCDHDVYNLSALPRLEAERLVARQMAGEGRLCVRMTRRLDGTVTTADAPACVGHWRAAAVRWSLRWGGPVGAALAMVVALLGCKEGKAANAADPQAADTTALTAVTSGMVERPPVATQPSTAPSEIDIAPVTPSTQPIADEPTLMGRMNPPRLQSPTTEPTR